MRLSKAQIKNFRSIKEITVNLDPTCRVLVGINESGKSNILKALSLMGEDYEPIKKDDMREALPEEDPITESSVRFVFTFEKSEADELLASVSEKVLASAKNPDIVLVGTAKKSLKEFCSERKESLYHVDILKENKIFRYWTLPTTYKLLTGWKKPSKSCPVEFTFESKGSTYQPSKYLLIRGDDFPELPAEHLDDATIEDLAKLSGGEITRITEKNLPNTLLWQYEEDNLLPNVVKIEEFSNDPSSCVPLRNMFILGGIEEKDIKTSIQSAKQGTDNQFQNYLDRIASKTTAHFREVWKEYKTIEFSLRLNADHIVPGIKEKNTHDLKRRSDGFKRFVTFLLLISVNVKTDNLQDTLLLIDEPDISLHPSGARYLRDELIRISKKNYVVYSTHSIFMIDSGDIGRHYIVKKKDEITDIVDAQSSNIADEEVLFNALGHSVFAILKEKNLIFEGWYDKHLFETVLENSSADLKKKYKDVGVCHGKGVGTIKAITPIIELAGRKCLVVSDGDKPAKQEQKAYKSSKGYGEWKTYQDIDSAIVAITGEDFIKNNYITNQVKAALTSTALPVFSETELPSDKGKLSAVSAWLSKNGMTAEQVKITIGTIKDAIFDNLKHQNIEGSYTKLLEGMIT